MRHIVHIKSFGAGCGLTGHFFRVFLFLGQLEADFYKVVAYSYLGHHTGVNVTDGVWVS